MQHQSLPIIDPPTVISIKDAIKLYGLEWLRNRPIQHGPYDVYINDSDLNAAIALWADEPENAFRNKRFYGSIIKNDPHHCSWIYSSELIAIKGIEINSAAQYSAADAYLVKNFNSLANTEKIVLMHRVFACGQYSGELGIIVEVLNKSFPGQTITAYRDGLYSQAVLQLSAFCTKVLDLSDVLTAGG